MTLLAEQTAPNAAPADPVDLAGLGRQELEDALAPLGLPKFRARQLWRWIYQRGETDFAAMTDLSKDLRARLAGHFTIGRPQIKQAQRSVDGTRKWLVRLADGSEVEAVFIPEFDRGTLCVSSQVGCTLNCRFCHTGTQRLVRNLTAAEIIGQILLARDELEDWNQTEDGRRLTNIVLMGMGEPLYNYENLRAALRIVMDGEGISISRRRITLSTAGVVPMMRQAGEELNVNLAVSLHATNDELRDRIVPLNRKYPIAEVMAACRDYPGISNARRITFEYVMLKDVNDSDEDAAALVRLLEGVPAKVNLIPFNPWPGSPFECSDEARIRRFGDLLARAGYASPVRVPRGRDISAACGQLKSESERQRRSRRNPGASEQAEASV